MTSSIEDNYPFEPIRYHNKELLDEAWAAYIVALQEIRNYNMYDRISIHKALPKAEAAFEYYCLLSKLLRKHELDD